MIQKKASGFQTVTDSNAAVFLSYASDDREAAQAICNDLRAANMEIWFDQGELGGGDAWDAKIRSQIKTCSLFLAVISAKARARDEGYFRLEWKLAIDRSYHMSGTRLSSCPWPSMKRRNRAPVSPIDSVTRNGSACQAAA